VDCVFGLLFLRGSEEVFRLEAWSKLPLSSQGYSSYKFEHIVDVLGWDDYAIVLDVEEAMG
jgi:hypothetical protein